MRMHDSVRPMKAVSSSISVCLAEVSLYLRRFLVLERAYGLVSLTVGLPPAGGESSLMNLYVELVTRRRNVGLHIEISEVVCPDLKGQRTFCGVVYSTRQPNSCERIHYYLSTDLEPRQSAFAETQNTLLRRGTRDWIPGFRLASTLSLIWDMQNLCWDLGELPPELNDLFG